MGMFDWINFKCPCPKCGQEVSGFQSKDRSCDLNTIEPDDVDNFYSSCDACKTWVEFYRPHTNNPKRAESLTIDQVIALGFELRSHP